MYYLTRYRRTLLTLALGLGVLFLLPDVAAAQSPWEHSAIQLANAFTGTIARALAMVAIVVGGVSFMFGEGGATRVISGIVFGGGLALAAPQVVAWLW